LSAIEHTIDHAYPVWESLQTIDLGRWPVIAQDSPGLFHNPALIRYLFLPFMAVFRSVIPVYLMVIALNTIAVWLTYLAARRLFGDERALIAAGLMAVNPWLVEFSRDIWLPALLPFFGALVLFLTLPLLTENDLEESERRALLALLAFTAMAHTYLLAFAAAIPVGLLVLIFWKRWPKRALLIGGFVFTATTAIYIGGLRVNREAPLERTISFTEGSTLTGEGWGHAVRLVSGADYEEARGRLAPIDDFALRHPPSRAAHWLVLAALLAGIGVVLYRMWKREGKWRGLLAALVWFAIPALMMSYVSQVVHPYYLLLTVPGGYILAAAGAGLVWRWAWGRWTLAVIGLLLVPLFGVNITRYYQETRAIPGAHDLWALPLDVGLEMGRTVRELTAEQTAPRQVFYEWESQIITSLAAVTIEADNDAVTDLPHLSTVLPDDDTLYVLFDDGDEFATPFGANEVDDRVILLTDGTAIRFYRYDLDADGLLAEFAPKRVDWQSNEGLTLVGYDLDAPLAPGKQVTLTTWWRVDHMNAPAREEWLFAPFVHVYDGARERVSIADGVPVPGGRWQVGALYIQQTPLDVPAESEGPYMLEVGQWDALRNVNVVFIPPEEEPTTVYRIEDSS
jgi:hypothetical protein